MADASGASEAVQNLHLDEVTGERVSKSELKKRQKQRTLEAKKAEKAAAAPPKPAKAKNAEAAEADLNPNQYFEIRSRAIDKLRHNHEPNPYPHKFHANYDLNKFEDEFSSLKTGETLKDKEIRVMARIFTKRSSGANLSFYDVRWETARVQVMCQAQENTSSVPFLQQHEHLRRGDVIGIIGFPGRTNPKNRAEGELSIFAQEIILLTPCLHMLPSEHYGFRDQEQRYRTRELDWIMNDASREVIHKRHKITRYIRQFFYNLDFIEPETPMMNDIAGGATAKPFKTYHNDLKMDLFMRVAPELFLKRMIIGGFPRVFELGRQFRNEDIDLTHNPEFTTCEFYWAGKDVYDLMEVTEELVVGLVQEVCGTTETTFHTQHGEEYKVNWARPWKRIEMIPALEEATGEKFPPGDQLHTAETNEFLKKLLAKHKIECSPPLTNARMIDKLTGEFIEEKCVNPTFIIEHPQMMSPLAKYHRSKPGLTERFEAFVCKKEIANAYTELNDPFDQRMRFQEQANQKAQGDDEAQLIDEAFCKGLEYGLPPTAGWGMGIDRMTMFLTDNYTIKEVLPFPFMKKENTEEKPKAAEVVGVEPVASEQLPQNP